MFESNFGRHLTKTPAKKRAFLFSLRTKSDDIQPVTLEQSSHRFACVHYQPPPAARRKARSHAQDAALVASRPSVFQRLLWDIN